MHQLPDGQLRVGDGSIPIANFTFTPNSNGGVLVDSLGRGCIATPGPAKQFQCDEGVQRKYIFFSHIPRSVQEPKEHADVTVKPDRASMSPAKGD